MGVKKLFWEDPYRMELEAEVTGVDGDAVTLDRTIFYAFSGGQASDAGTIGGREVLRAELREQEIVYTLPPDHGLRPGQAVAVSIDGDRRRRLVRLHFAAELVLELVYQGYGHPERTGANITLEKARLDFLWDGDISAVFPAVQARLERLVAEDLPVVSAFSDEAAQRRYWAVEGFARVPCCGTHPRRTGEVGAVALGRRHLGRGKERIEITLAD